MIAKIQENQAALDGYGVKSLALFGSATRDSLRTGSDLDILVPFDQTTWGNYIALKLYLEDLLGRQIDLVTHKALRPIIRPSIEKNSLH